jgi:simple sugar transport system substrate-binding protein
MSVQGRQAEGHYLHTILRKALVATAALGGIGFGAVTLPATARDVKSIAIMLPENPTDFGWNQQGFDAAAAVAKRYGLKFMPAPGLGYGDVQAAARELADDGASLIIAHASGYNTAILEIGAEKHVAVAITDRPDADKPGAVADYTVGGYQAAYLAGILAAKTSKSKTLGVVVAAEPPAYNSQSAAFAQGARATDPKVKILYAVIGPAAYADAAGGRRVTDSVIGAGADVIFGQGDGASFGMLQAAETARPAGGGKVWFIDNVGDKRPLDKGSLLSSVLWNLVPIYAAMVEDLKTDKFGTHGYALKLADDSVQLLHTKYISDDVWASLAAARNQIVAGSLKIEPIWDAPKVRALMTSVTNAPKK